MKTLIILILACVITTSASSQILTSNGIKIEKTDAYKQVLKRGLKFTTDENDTLNINLEYFCYVNDIPINMTDRESFLIVVKNMKKYNNFEYEEENDCICVIDNETYQKKFFNKDGSFKYGLSGFIRGATYDDIYNVLNSYNMLEKHNSVWLTRYDIRKNFLDNNINYGDYKAIYTIINIGNSWCLKYELYNEINKKKYNL